MYGVYYSIIRTVNSKRDQTRIICDVVRTIFRAYRREREVVAVVFIPNKFIPADADNAHEIRSSRLLSLSSGSLGHIIIFIYQYIVVKINKMLSYRKETALQGAL